MFYIKNAKRDRYTGKPTYGVVDTDDWVLEYYSKKTLLRLSKKIKINGISEGRFEYYDILPFVEKNLAKLCLVDRVPVNLYIKRTLDWSIKLISDDIVNAVAVGGILQIPEGVEIVSRLGVRNNLALKKVILPNSVRNIEVGVFLGCKNLIEVKMSSNIEVIQGSAFSNCQSLEGVDLGNCLTEIESEVFQDCVSLSSIKFPESLTTIGASAFKRTSLKELDLPINLRYVSSHAFDHCLFLERVTIRGNVDFGDSAFVDCKSLKFVDFSSWGGDTIAPRLFMNCVNLKAVSVPYGVVEIGHHAFTYCYSLESIRIPNSVKKIGMFAFESCMTMTTLEFEDRFTELKIEANCFKYCRSLVSVKLPRCTELGSNAFYGCGALEEVIIEAQGSCINFLAFANCTSLRRIEIRGTGSRSVSLQQSTLRTLTELKEVVVSADNNNLEFYQSLFGDKLKIV